MATIMIRELSLSEVQASDELSVEELEAVAGGGPAAAAIGGMIGALASAMDGGSVTDVLASTAAGMAIGFMLPTP